MTVEELYDSFMKSSKEDIAMKLASLTWALQNAKHISGEQLRARYGENKQ